MSCDPARSTPHAHTHTHSPPLPAQGKRGASGTARGGHNDGFLLGRAPQGEAQLTRGNGPGFWAGSSLLPVPVGLGLRLVGRVPVALVHLVRLVSTHLAQIAPLLTATGPSDHPPTPAQISPLLTATADLLRAFPDHFAHCVVAVARKTDAALWPALFSAVGPPSALLEGLLEEGALGPAACFLLVIDRWGGPRGGRLG